MDYRRIGAAVAEKTWTNDYDCSNFSVAFYKACKEAGLPARVRSGDSGGSNFRVGRHAWNSVLIDGRWLDWEPQLNEIYNGHTQTWTNKTFSHDKTVFYYSEDFTRMRYELVGSTVPWHVIDSYEIDDNMPQFYEYFGGKIFNGADYTVNDGEGIWFYDDGTVVYAYHLKGYLYEKTISDPPAGRNVVAVGGGQPVKIEIESIK